MLLSIQTDTTFYQRYPYVRFVADGDTIQLTDAEFLDLAGQVVFAINKAELPADAPLLKELAEQVLPQAMKDSLQLKGIVVRGTASPEGPFAVNQRLSEARARALADYINQRLQHAAPSPRR